MPDDIRRELETFLFEDLVTGLGNIRMSLVWMDDNAPPAVAEDRGRGIKRLDAQLAWLEDRANTVYSRLHGYSGPVALGPATLGDAGPVEIVPVAEGEPAPRGTGDAPPPDAAPDAVTAGDLEDAVPPPTSPQTPGGLPPQWLSGAEPHGAAPAVDDTVRAAPATHAGVGADPVRPDRGEVAHAVGTDGPCFEAGPTAPTAPVQAALDPVPESAPMDQAVPASGERPPDPGAVAPVREAAKASEPDQEAAPDLAENEIPVENVFGGPLAGPRADATNVTDAATDPADVPKATDQTPPEARVAAGDADLSPVSEKAAAAAPGTPADAAGSTIDGDESPAQGAAVAANDAVPRLGEDTAAVPASVAPLLDATLAEAVRAPDPNGMAVDEHPAAPGAAAPRAEPSAAGDPDGPPATSANLPPGDAHAPGLEAQSADSDDLGGAAEPVDRVSIAPLQAAGAQVSVVETAPQDGPPHTEIAPGAAAAEPETAPMAADMGGNAAATAEAGPEAMEGVEAVATGRQDLSPPPAHSAAPDPDRGADRKLVLGPDVRAVPEDGSDGPATPVVEEEDLSASIDQLL